MLSGERGVPSMVRSPLPTCRTATVTSALRARGPRETKLQRKLLRVLCLSNRFAKSFVPTSSSSRAGFHHRLALLVANGEICTVLQKKRYGLGIHIREDRRLFIEIPCIHVSTQP